MRCTGVIKAVCAKIERRQRRTSESSEGQSCFRGRACRRERVVMIFSKHTAFSQYQSQVICTFLKRQSCNNLLTWEVRERDAKLPSDQFH